LTAQHSHTQFINKSRDFLFLITGGTGFIGRRVQTLLRVRGYRSCILTRRPDLDESTEDFFVGDLVDASACRRAVAGVNTVIHIAGEKLDPTRFELVNIKGTKNLLVASIDERIQRFVYVSSLGILGADPLQVRVFDENAQCRPRNGYERSKWEAEKVVQETGREGLAVAILRPANVFGDCDPDQTFLELARTVRDGRFVFLGGRNSLINMVFVEDVAHAVLALAEHPNAAGGIYHLSDTCTIGEFVDALSEELHVQKPGLEVPALLVWFSRVLLKALRRSPGVSHSSTFDRLISLNNQASFATSRLADELGFHCPVGWRAGLGRMVRWYRSQGEL